MEVEGGKELTEAAWEGVNESETIGLFSSAEAEVVFLEDNFIQGRVWA